VLSGNFRYIPLDNKGVKNCDRDREFPGSLINNANELNCGDKHSAFAE